MAARKHRKQSTRASRRQSPEGSELLVLELQEIHNAESQLSRVLPRLMKSAESEQLGRMLQQRQDQGERLIREIEDALAEMDERPRRRRNAAAEGLINDTRERIQEIAAGPALDAVLIAGAQKTEHYCIAAWGTAKSLAQEAEEQKVVRAMERALEEGKSLDEELTQLAESEINPAVFSGDEEADQDGQEDEQEQGRRRGGQQRRRQGRQPRGRQSRRGSGSERRAST